MGNAVNRNCMTSGFLELQDKYIIAVGAVASLEFDEGRFSVPRGGVITNFITIHLHGGQSLELEYPDLEQYRRVAASLKNTFEPQSVA